MQSMTFFELLSKYSIHIPIIQRDYAQGRKDSKIESLRQELLDDIFICLVSENKKLDFDFIYGSVKDNIFYPIDGQQRLTTLWLLHWYIANRAGFINSASYFTSSCEIKTKIHIDEMASQEDLFVENSQKEPISIRDILNKFSYQTRTSSKRFCEKLVDFTSINISEEIKLSSEIYNQVWFMAAWVQDPTISAMLNMIDCIHETCNKYIKDNDISKIFKKLFLTHAISFSQLNMEAFDLEDELYIKMNARGKVLSEFENFKANFISKLEENKKVVSNISAKLDKEWLDFFWNEVKYHQKGEAKNLDQEVDAAMLNYFIYVANLKIGKIEGELPSKELSIAEKIIKNKVKLEFLIASLDKLASLKDVEKAFDISDKYFETYYTENEEDKSYLANELLPIYSSTKKFLLSSLVASNYERELLFASLLNLVCDREERKKLRIIRNFTINSNLASNYKDGIDQTIYDIITNEKLELKSDLLLENINMLEHEQKKLALLENKIDLEKALYRLEDHDMLRGKLFVFEDVEKIEGKKHCKGFNTYFAENLENTSAVFEALFKVEDKKGNIYSDYYNTVSRAILCFGDYKQGIHLNWDVRYWCHKIWFSLANSYSTWKEHFSFINLDLNKPLQDLIKEIQLAVDNDICNTLEKIINNHLSQYKDYDWRYYTIKYPAMNSGEKISRLSFLTSDEDLKARIVNEKRISLFDHDKYRGYWRDPYFSAIKKILEEDGVKDNEIVIYSKDATRLPLRIEPYFSMDIVDTESWSWKISIQKKENINENEIQQASLIFEQFCKTYSDGIVEVKEKEDRIKKAVTAIKYLIELEKQCKNGNT